MRLKRWGPADAMNYKNLNYEIETRGPADAMNYKNLNYEIETASGRKVC